MALAVLLPNEQRQGACRPVAVAERQRGSLRVGDARRTEAALMDPERDDVVSDEDEAEIW